MNGRIASRISLNTTRTPLCKQCPHIVPRWLVRRVCQSAASPLWSITVSKRVNWATVDVTCRSASLIPRAFHTHPRKRKELRDDAKGAKEERDLDRSLGTAKKLRTRLTANFTHENIYTLPNFLTFSRLLAAPAIGYLILHDSHAWAVGLFFYAGITDLVDGWIARKWNQQTVVGTIVDPLADKALMTILTICLAVQGGLPVWLATMILGRDVSLAISATYYRFASLPPPKTFPRYWDFSLPSAEVYPTGISKANTFLQLVLIGATTALPVAGPAVDSLLQSHGLADAVGGVDGIMTAAQYLVATTTVWSGASYLYTKNAVKILNGSDETKMRILVKGRMVLGVSFLCCLGLALALEY